MDLYRTFSGFSSAPRALVVLLLTFGLATLAVAAEPQYPSGGRVGLTPPAGMQIAQGFAGFMDSDSGASMVIAEFPAEAFADLERGFTDAALAQQAIRVEAREDWTPEGGRGFLISGSQSVQSVAYDKWMLVLGFDDLCVLLTVQSPQAAGAYDDDSIRTALSSLRLRPRLSLQQEIDKLPYSIETIAGFRVTRTLAGAALLLTEGPLDVIKRAEQPVVMIVGDIENAPPARAQRAQVARELLLNNRTFVDTTILSQEAGPGSDDITLYASARQSDEDVELALIQVVRFHDGGWIQTLGVIAPDAADQYRDRVLQVAAGVRPR